MKVYKTIEGIVIENENVFYLSKQTDWDQFINDDNLYAKIKAIIHSLPQTDKSTIDNLLAPVGTQELWACGVTYYRSMVGRQEESKEAGGGDFYARVYNAERPEVFFKSPAYRIVHPNGFVRIRKDSTWDVPEPELTLVVTSSAKIVGYTIGNDMSSRSIEGENPLYLPQAKTYDGAAAVGPCIYVTENPLNASAKITMQIYRKEALVFEGEIAISQIKRSFDELVSFVYKECSFHSGCLIMTGTGIVPGNNFTLKRGDKVSIEIEGIGKLTNTVA